MWLEVPALKRCCFCFPSRYGLLTIAYIRMVLCLSFLSGCYERMSWLVVPEELEVPAELYPLEVIDAVLCTVFNLLNLVYSILLITAAHKKSEDLFKVFCTWEFIGLIVNVLLVAAIKILDAYIMWYYGMDIFHYIRLKVMMMDLIPYLLYFCLQLYLLSLAKNEIKKLSVKHNLRIINIGEKEGYEFTC